MTEQDLLELRVEMTGQIELSGRVETEGICWICGSKQLNHVLWNKEHDGYTLFEYCQGPERHTHTEYFGADY